MWKKAAMTSMEVPFWYMPGKVNNYYKNNSLDCWCLSRESKDIPAVCKSEMLPTELPFLTM